MAGPYFNDPGYGWNVPQYTANQLPGVLPDPTQTGIVPAGPLSGQPAAPRGVLSGGGGFGGLRAMLADPSVMWPIAAQLIGGATPQASFAGALNAAGPAIGDMRRRAAMNAYLKAHSGLNLTPEEQQLLQSDPELGRAFIAQQLTPKPPTWGVIGKDSSGAEQYGWINASSQTVTPVTAPGAGSGRMFPGTSVEATALSWLVDNGKLTPNQAAQLAASKQVTGGDGTIYLATPEGIFGKPPGGGPAAPVGQEPPQDGSAPNGAGGAGAGMIPIGKGKQTEAAARASGLLVKSAPDYKQAIAHFDALNSFQNQALGGFGSPGRFFQSSEYKVAYNAAKGVVGNYQYVASGAAAPEEEVIRNLDSVLPNPSDDAATIADKKVRLGGMMQAMQIVAEGGQIPRALVKQIGLNIEGEGVEPPTADEVSAAGVAAAPPRPANVPAGSAYSPSRKRWKSPDGAQMFDEQGTLVQ